jgi:hypothetical protein
VTGIISAMAPVNECPICYVRGMKWVSHCGVLWRLWMVVLSALLTSACATVPAPTSNRGDDACPNVAQLWMPRPDPKTVEQSSCAAWDSKVVPSVVPFGPDLKRALCYVARYYVGPDGLRVDAMLASALRELTRVYPTFQVAPAAGGSFLLSFSSGSRSINAANGDPALLYEALVRAAQLGREVLADDAIRANGTPEHVLLQGALAALASKTRIRPPAGVALAPLESQGPTAGPSSVSIDSRQIAHLTIGEFSPGMAERLRRELAHQGKLRGVVLDLRGSLGGLLDEGISLIDLFVRRGCIFVMRPAITRRQVAHDSLDDIDAPLVVLIDHATAEGAELVAASLRVRQRAVLVGETTLGMGVVHEVLRMEGGTLLKIEIGELLAADGKPFSGTGIIPDLSVPATFAANLSSDRDAAFAGQLLERTAGNQRADLLKAAAAFVASAATH